MKFLSFLIVFSTLTTTAWAEDLSQVAPLTARGFFVSETQKPGQLADLQVELRLQEGFWAYHDRFQLKVTEPQNIQTGEINISPIVEFTDTTGKKKKQKKGVKDSATLKTQVEIPTGIDQLKSMTMALTYIACTPKYCLTPRTFEFQVPVSIIQTSSPSKKDQDVFSSASIVEKIESNLLLALVLIFCVGLLTSLTPCVYPLIPITLAVLGNNQNRPRWQSFLVSLSYVIGIGITYALLGVIAARTGSLFGSFISHPLVIISMSLVFLAMGLSLLGLFEIQAPSFIRNKANNSQGNHGYWSAFSSGLLAGVIASPCVGPVLVGILAYIAKTQSSFLGFVLLFTFAMGFGVLFIALGTFSQLAGRLPRSGTWMNAIKTVLALALFGMSFYYAFPLIKKHLPTAATKTTGEKVPWQAFHPDLVKQASTNNKPVIIDFYADWCAACVEMDQFTFSKKPVIEFSKNFVMLKVDATSPFKELNDWQQTYEVFGLPTMIFIDKNGKVLTDLTLTGFEEAELFIKRMEQALQKQ